MSGTRNAQSIGARIADALQQFCEARALLEAPLLELGVG